MKDYSAFEKEQIAEAFRVFAYDECKGSSALYYKLCNKIAEDVDLLNIAAKVRYGQPVPNSFLASVHFLLLANTGHSLAHYYPSISKREIEEIPFTLFKAFCIENKDKIIQIVADRIVQTNAINRCSYLAPIFSKLIEDNHERAVTMIDIGTSAGLTLNWNKYEYNYNKIVSIGKSNTKVNAEVRDSAIPEFKLPKKEIRKIGIDQHIIDPANIEEARWLQALIWPDQLERFEILNEALKNEDLKTIEFIEADTVIDFAKIIEAITKENLLIVYCTHAMYQFPIKMKEEFWEMLDKVGEERDFYFLSAEVIKSQREKYNAQNAVVELTIYKDGTKKQSLMAEANSHGNWFTWKA